MGDDSAGKMTITSVGDKITLHHLVGRMNTVKSAQEPTIKQCNLLLWMRLRNKDSGSVYYGATREDVRSFVENFVKPTDKYPNFDFIIKPTHASSGQGVIVMSQDRWKREGYNEEKLFETMLLLLFEKTSSSESKALQAIIPGVIVQEKYPIPDKGESPIEVK